MCILYLIAFREGTSTPQRPFRGARREAGKKGKNGSARCMMGRGKERDLLLFSSRLLLFLLFLLEDQGGASVKKEGSTRKGIRCVN